MLYISHLLDDDEMRRLTARTGMGVESIEFSIAENLDRLDEKLYSYEQRLRYIYSTGADTSGLDLSGKDTSRPELSGIDTSRIDTASKGAERSLTLHGPFLDLNPAAFDSLVQQATMTRFEQCYQAAQRLGARKIIFHSGFVPSVYFLEGWAERVADFFGQFLEHKTDEIQILMENVLDPFPQPIAEVAERIGHPAFGICLDVGHANCYSEIACDEWIETLAPHIRHLHLHDNCGDRDSHLALGDGTLRQEKILALLNKKIDATIECRTEKDVLQTYRIIR